MGDYQRLRTEAGDAESPLPPVQPVLPRTFLHKLLFVSCLVLILGLVVIFLWVLPCDLTSCKAEDPIPFTWDQTLYGLELKGRMHLVAGHLVCILRGALWGKDPVSGGYPPHEGGVIALSAVSGQTIWWSKLAATPIHIDCSILATGHCLILGQGGYLAAIDPISGMIRWRMGMGRRDKDGGETWSPPPVDMDFPLRLEVAGGGAQLVTLSKYKQGHHRLLFIAPDSGAIIAHQPLPNDCAQVYNLTYYEGVLHYVCTNVIGGVRTMKYELGGYSSPGAGPERGAPVDPLRRLAGDRMSSGEHRVMWTNTGSGPGTGSVQILVTDSTNRTLWSYSAPHSYLMTPLPLRYKPAITGFLFKLWQWHKSTKLGKGISAELIKERIVLITFNKSGNMHVVNTSQIDDITQLCYDTECQPQISFQTQSALLADVNGDESQELISYLVTYRCKEPDLVSPSLADWELLSKVKVVRLESELSKLYRPPLSGH